MLNRLQPIALLATLLFAGGLLLIRSNARLTADLSISEQRALHAEGVVITLKRDMAEQEAARQQLAATLTTLRTAAAQRQATIEELINENAELKDWASRPVPDAIADRLQRPASAGVSHYQQQLSRRSALHPQPDKPPD